MRVGCAQGGTFIDFKEHTEGTMEVQFAAGGRQIAPTVSFIDFKQHKERIMEVKFAAGWQLILPTFTFVGVAINISAFQRSRYIT